MAYLSWYDVSFLIPCHFTMMERLTGRAGLQNVADGSFTTFKPETDELNGLPKQTLVCKSGKIYRQIVTSQTGYVLPGEMVAILGPSGSGKTSLLNALCHRTASTSGSIREGSIKINGHEAGKGEYSTIGAYV